MRRRRLSTSLPHSYSFLSSPTRAREHAVLEGSYIFALAMVEQAASAEIGQEKAEAARSAPQPPMEARKTTNWGFLPIPKHCQYDPALPTSQFKFTMFLNVWFGLSATLTVANLVSCMQGVVYTDHT